MNEVFSEMRRALGFDDDDVVVGTVGRMVREKGFGEFFEAARAIRSSEPQARFLAIGDRDPEKWDSLSPQQIEAAEMDVTVLGWGEDVAELMGRAVREVEVVFARPVPPAALEGVPGVTRVVADGKDASTLRLTVTGSLDPTVKALAAYPVVDLISQLPDLEDVFMTFYAGEGDDRAS